MKRLTIVLWIFVVFVLSGCTLSNRPTLVEGAGLNTVKGETELKTLLKSTNDSFFYGMFGTFRNFGVVDSMVPESSMDDSLGGKLDSDDYTTTNVQVEGVDEGDIVKTDGRRIYSISYNSLKVVDLYEDGKMQLALYETLEADASNDVYYNYTYFSDLYVTEDYLVVIGQRYAYTIMYRNAIDGRDADDTVDYWGYYYQYTAMSVAYIYDIETLEKVEEFEISGNLLTSRLIDNRLYFISNHFVYASYLDEKEYDPRPWIVQGGEETYIPYEDIKYIPDMIYQSFTVISTIFLEEEISSDQQVFLGANSWGQIYVSLNAIYFATTYFERTLLDAYKTQGRLISYMFDPDTKEVVYGGTGVYEGYVLNQFSMDEYDGFMRIATTEGWGEDVKNRLYVFERIIENRKYVLKQVGIIDEGLGKPRERIQSVRFNKTQATVVTFEQIDPFYTIDLSDPTKPRIVGELEVTGFSVYQHPWLENMVIGIGFEVIDGITIGLKLSLYDISDFENPVEIGKPLVLGSGPNAWAYSEALYNHKAILSDPSRGFLGFSLYRSSWADGYYSSMNDYLVFEIDPTAEQPINIKYTINHIDYFEDEKDLYRYYWYYSFTIERAVRIDDYLYVLSGEVITSHSLVGEFNTADAVIYAKANR